eukprot:m.189245 g.189245  ORF g.189245 m.189245 type:complete len:432 (-) comp16938_c1_seq46:502-1797(-)
MTAAGNFVVALILQHQQTVRSCISNMVLIMVFSLMLSVVGASAASNSSESLLSTDDDGRLHITNNHDVLIQNISIQDLYQTVLDLNSSLAEQSEEMAQIELRLNEACFKNETTSMFTINWTSVREDKHFASNGTTNDGFGYAVATFGHVVVVGASQSIVNGKTSGSAYVYEKNSTGQYEEVSNLVSNGATGDLFGFSVAASDNMVVVGAHGEGAAYVFEKNSTGQYEQVEKILAGDDASSDSFGYAVAAAESTVVVSAYWANNLRGAVYVYEKDDTGQYKEVDKLAAHDGADRDEFGSSIAVTQHMIVVGAQSDDDKDPNSGSAYVYEKNSTGQYEQVAKLVASDGAIGDRFGNAVAASDGMAVIGAHYNGNSEGSAYVFEKNSTGQYIETDKLSTADVSFGSAVAVSSHHVIVGAFRAVSETGVVYVYGR